MPVSRPRAAATHSPKAPAPGLLFFLCSSPGACPGGRPNFAQTSASTLAHPLQADLRKGFKHFAPRFPRHSDPSLTEASALNVAFVFQKTTGAPAAPPLRGGARGGSGPQQQQAQQKRKADWGEQRQQQQGPGGDRGARGGTAVAGYSF